MASILVAATPDGATAIERILGQRHELSVIETTAKALARIRDHEFDLILIEVQFDQSRMLDLLAELQKSPPRGHRPGIICFCTRDTELTRAMHETVDLVTNVLGAWMYLDQHKFNVTRNPDAELRRIIERCLSGEAIKKTQARRGNLQKEREKLLELRLSLENEEWSQNVENRVSALRQTLSKVLLELSEMQTDTTVQRKEIAESKKQEDRVSLPVKLTEIAIEREETQIERKEQEQLAREQEIFPVEEARGEKGRHKRARKPNDCENPKVVDPLRLPKQRKGNPNIGQHPNESAEMS